VPTYQYACTECGHQLEAVQSFSDAALTECPACHGKLRKVFNSVGIVFKGTGFYRNDSRADKVSAEKAEASAGKSDAPKADAPKSDAPKSDGAKSDGAKSDAPKPAKSDSSPSSSSSSSSGTKAGTAPAA
jgi:putative FmdB family regulatory protein